MVGRSPDEKAAALLVAWLAAVELYQTASAAFLRQHQVEILASLTRMEQLLAQPWTPSWSVPPGLVARVEAQIAAVRQLLVLTAQLAAQEAQEAQEAQAPQQAPAAAEAAVAPRPERL